MSKWDDRFMAIAREVASWSKDPSTKVGCVIVDHDRRILATGYNGFPRYVRDDDARYLNKDMKYKLVVHAEANAILNRVSGVSGMTLYATKFPCSECSKLIIQSGISRIIAPAPDLTGKWGEDAKFSTLMLSEATISIHQL